MEFPSVDEVAGVLERIQRAAARTARAEGDEDEVDTWRDVRLQVMADGSWRVWSGDASYDTDHSGYWGASSLSAESDVVEVARELVDEARESAAECGEEDEDEDEDEG